MESKNGFDVYEFEDYLLNKYGIRMNLVSGNITDGYEIVDEKNIWYFY